MPALEKFISSDPSEHANVDASDSNSHWSLWNLSVNKGRQVWQFSDKVDIDKDFLERHSKSFEFDKAHNPNSGDKPYRSKIKEPKFERCPDWISKPHNYRDSILLKAGISHFKAINYYAGLQSDDGHWPGDYGGPLFLLPGLIFASYLTQTPFPKPHQELMKRYMLNHQNNDGGWGLHIEGPSTMFGTVMQYVALRILNADRENAQLTAARNWILEHGGARYIPSWGKFYLSLLNLYEWEGCNPLLPELWLLPKSLSIHPSKFWCHARMVFLPMSYCYGHHIKIQADELILSLRNDIYCENYDSIKWSKNIHLVSSTDNFRPVSRWLKIINKILRLCEKIRIKKWKRKALDFALLYIRAEDDQTNYVDIGPVNQVLNSICIWHAFGKDSEYFKKHVDRWYDYLWIAEDGMKMNGYNGSQLWDTAFATQSIIENHSIVPQFMDTLERAYAYIDHSQVRTEVKDREMFFRHPSVGGWPFSTLDHGWPISDCTAEGLYTILSLHDLNFPFEQPQIKTERLEQAIDLILSLQNKNGGWATYENQRSGRLLEILNSSEVFGKIMIDYSWTECTSACLKALMEFKKFYPEYKSKQIGNAVQSGVKFISSKQRKDGSWVGSWGICFTYGTWFALEALSKYNRITGAQNDKSIERGCEFLISRQKTDGGWGESYLSCVKDEYIQHENSQVVNTSWALLALMAADYPDRKPIDRGIRLIIDRQQQNGDWLQEGISGVFNQNCMITYAAYRNTFTTWALGRYLKKYN